MNRVNRKPTEWEKISSNYASDKALTSESIRNFNKSTNKEQTTPLKSSKGHEQTLLKRGHISVQQT